MQYQQDGRASEPTGTTSLGAHLCHGSDAIFASFWQSRYASSVCLWAFTKHSLFVYALFQGIQGSAESRAFNESLLFTWTTSQLCLPTPLSPPFFCTAATNCYKNWDFWGFDFGAQTYGPIVICQQGTITFRWQGLYGVYQIPRPGICPPSEARLRGASMPTTASAQSLLASGAGGTWNGTRVSGGSAAATEGEEGLASDSRDFAPQRDELHIASAGFEAGPGAESSGPLIESPVLDPAPFPRSALPHPSRAPEALVHPLHAPKSHQSMPGASGPKPVPLPLPSPEAGSDFQELLPPTQGWNEPAGMYVWVLPSLGTYYATTQTGNDCEDSMLLVVEVVSAYV